MTNIKSYVAFDKNIRYAKPIFVALAHQYVACCGRRL